MITEYINGNNLRFTNDRFSYSFVEKWAVRKPTQLRNLFKLSLFANTILNAEINNENRATSSIVNHKYSKLKLELGKQCNDITPAERWINQS